MSTRKIRKIVYIYCEGDSEKNYFEALKRNKNISCNYVLKVDSSENHLDNAIEKSEKLHGVDKKIIYVYDSDDFRKHKKVTSKIEMQKDNIYFSEENFEDFLSCHKTKKVYRDKKPRLSRQIIEEIGELNIQSLRKCIKNPRKFGKFKSIYDLLEELFEQKL